MWQSPDSKTYNKNWIWLPFFQWKKEFGKVSPIVEQYCSEPIRTAEPWDILLSVRAPVWPTNLVDQKCCIGRWLWAIRPNKKYSATPYLLYYFKKFQTEIANLGKWSTFDAITKADLENIEIPLPPLPTQHAIVACLDEVSEYIQSAKSAIQDQINVLDVLWQSSLSKVFDNEDYELKKLSEVMTEPKKSEIQISDDELCSFVPMSDMSQEAMYFNAKQKKVIWEVRKWYTYFTNNDVLLAKVTPCFENGKSGVAKDLSNLW